MLVTSLVSGILLTSLFIGFSLVSYGEKEKKASARAFGLGVLILIPYIINQFLSTHQQSVVSIILVVIPLVTMLIMIIPLRKKVPNTNENPAEQIDERDVMFSRKLLYPGNKNYEEYYADKPDKKEADDEFRKHPGLLNEKSSLYEPFTFKMADAIFNVIKGMHGQVDGQVAPIQNHIPAGHITPQIINWLLEQGCISAGITEMSEYHYYSHVGRGEDIGKPVTLRHRFGIAFTVEMRKEMMDCAPQGPTVLESAQQYLNATVIAIQLARYIRELGYPARAHIDGNYRVVCPLVARDAGLGDIGRMGLLMTPQLGPRVRLAVVTTDLPLTANMRQTDAAMLDFCNSCKKCAEVCPSRAISFGDRSFINGVCRWQIDQEACYTLWCKLGTDCGRCMAVCPYSHPDSLMHNLVRYGIRHSWIFSRIALLMDNFFYGKKPTPKPLPEWIGKS